MPFNTCKTSQDSIINQEKEKAQLKERLDSIQSKLEYIVIPKIELRAKILKKNNELISKIKLLKEGLSKPKGLTPIQLKRAKEDVQHLTYFVLKYCSDIESLKFEQIELEKSKTNH